MTEAVQALVGRLIEAGCAPELAASAIAEAFAAGAASGPARSARQARNRRYYESHRPKLLEKAGDRRKRLNPSEIKTSSDAPSRLPLEDTPTEPATKSRRGTRMAADWMPSPADVAYAQEQGMAPERIANCAAKFKNHWLAKAGKDGAKLDWPATWRNWVLNDLEWNGGARPPPADRLTTNAPHRNGHDHENKSAGPHRSNPPSRPPQTRADAVLAGMGRLARRVSDRGMADRPEESGSDEGTVGPDAAEGTAVKPS